MADSTGAAAWAAVVVAGAAALGIHPSSIAAAALGAGVGLVIGSGLGRVPAMILAALMTLASPLLAAWAVSLRPTWFGAQVTATAGLAFLIAFLGPTLLRLLQQHMPTVAEAVAARLANVIKGDRK